MTYPRLAYRSKWLEELRKATERLREIPITDPRWKEIYEERERIARGPISERCWDIGVYLFDANHAIEKTSNLLEFEEEERALESLDDSRSYYRSAFRKGYISKEEYTEMERYLKEVKSLIKAGNYDKALTALGDADRLAKRLLFEKISECICKEGK